MVVVAALALWAAWRFVAPRLPPADRPLALNAEAHRPAFTTAQVRRAIESEASRIVDIALLEAAHPAGHAFRPLPPGVPDAL